MEKENERPISSNLERIVQGSEQSRRNPTAIGAMAKVFDAEERIDADPIPHSAARSEKRIVRFAENLQVRFFNLDEPSSKLSQPVAFASATGSPPSRRAQRLMATSINRGLSVDETIRQDDEAFNFLEYMDTVPANPQPCDRPDRVVLEHTDEDDLIDESVIVESLSSDLGLSAIGSGVTPRNQLSSDLQNFLREIDATQHLDMVTVMSNHGADTGRTPLDVVMKAISGWLPHFQRDATSSDDISDDSSSETSLLRRRQDTTPKERKSASDKGHRDLVAGAGLGHEILTETELELSDQDIDLTSVDHRRRSIPRTTSSHSTEPVIDEDELVVNPSSVRGEALLRRSTTVSTVALPTSSSSSESTIELDEVENAPPNVFTPMEPSTDSPAPLQSLIPVLFSTEANAACSMLCLGQVPHEIAHAANALRLLSLCATKADVLPSAAPSSTAEFGIMSGTSINEPSHESTNHPEVRGGQIHYVERGIDTHLTLSVLPHVAEAAQVDEWSPFQEPYQASTGLPGAMSDIGDQNPHPDALPAPQDNDTSTHFATDTVGDDYQPPNQDDLLVSTHGGTVQASTVGEAFESTDEVLAQQLDRVRTILRADTYEPPSNSAIPRQPAFDLAKMIKICTFSPLRDSNRRRERVRDSSVVARVIPPDRKELRRRQKYQEHSLAMVPQLGAAESLVGQRQGETRQNVVLGNRENKSKRVRLSGPD